MVVGLGILAGGAAIAASSPNIETLVAGRAVQGLGAALILPATLSIITNIFPAKERATAIGIWAGVGGLGFGFGPVIGGSLVTRLDWPAIFWLHLPIIAIVLLGMLIVDESETRRTYLDISGSALISVGLASFVYGIIRAGEHQWSGASTLAAFAVAAVALTGFVRVELSSAEPLLPLRLFRRRDFTGAVVLIGVTVFAFFVTLFFLTQYLQVLLERSAFRAGLIMIPMALATMITAPLAGWLMLRVGPRPLLIAVTLLMSGGTVLLIGIDIDTSVWSPMPSLIAFGLGFGLGEVPLTDTIMAALPRQEAGVGSAVNDVSRELGGALGIAVIGSVVNARYRSELSGDLPAIIPAEVRREALEGVAVADSIARDLSDDAATQLIEAAREAFLGAIATGFTLSALVLFASTALVLATIPSRAP